MGMADSGMTHEQHQEAWRERGRQMEKARHRDEQEQRQGKRRRTDGG